MHYISKDLFVVGRIRKSICCHIYEYTHTQSISEQHHSAIWEGLNWKIQVNFLSWGNIILSLLKFYRPLFAVVLVLNSIRNQFLEVLFHRKQLLELAWFWKKNCHHDIYFYIQIVGDDERTSIKIQWPNLERFELQFPNSTNNVLCVCTLYSKYRVFSFPFWTGVCSVYYVCVCAFFLSDASKTIVVSENVQRRHIKASWWNHMQ